MRLFAMRGSEVRKGLERILAASSPEELFSSGNDDRPLLHELLIAVSEGAGSPHYPEIREVARRHRVNLGDVTDRAALFLTVVRERQRMDLYRTLGVPPLAAAETLQRRWRAIVKETHPDKGGDVARFHHARRAYEVLRDPARRVEYERFWQRAIAPFQDFAGADPAAPADRSA